MEGRVKFVEGNSAETSRYHRHHKRRFVLFAILKANPFVP